MKCVKRTKGNESSIKRVSNDLAKHLVEKEGYNYCPKIEWKNSGRLK